jgi:HK97 family phage major capsid protein
MTTKTKAIPANPEELADFLTQPDQWPDEVKSKGGLQAFLTQYGQQLMSGDPTLMQQVNEQVQKGLRDFMKEFAGQNSGVPRVDLADNGAPRLRGFASQAPVNGGFPTGSYQVQKQCLYNKAARNAALDKIVNSFPEFLQGVAAKQRGFNFRNRDKLIEQMDKIAEIQNTFGTDAPSDGGFLVPEEFRSDLLMVALEHGIIRPRATVIPMSSQTLAIPTVDDKDHSAGALFGGVQTYWVDESTQPTESSGKFAQVKLDAKKLMAYLSAPSELAADAPAFNAYTNQVLPQAIAFEEDYRFIQGNGAGQPLGYLNSAGIVTASTGSHLGANTIGVEDLANMFARLLPSSIMNAIWVADIGAFPQLAVLAVQGSIANSSPVWMNNGIIGAPPMAIYGRPLFFTEKCPSLGSLGDISIVDPSFYLVGDRQSVSVSMSEHFAFASDKIAYKVIERIDGRPWLQSAITPRNGGNTISAYVNLSATRT